MGSKNNLVNLQIIRLNSKKSQDYKWLTREQADALDAKDKLILDEIPCIEVVYGANEFGISENSLV